MKKLLLLGGANFLLPVIREAHALGLYVICRKTRPTAMPTNTGTSQSSTGRPSSRPRASSGSTGS